MRFVRPRPKYRSKAAFDLCDGHGMPSPDVSRTRVSTSLATQVILIHATQSEPIRKGLLFDNVRLPHCAQSESVIDSSGKNSQLESAKPSVKLRTPVWTHQPP